MWVQAQLMWAMGQRSIGRETTCHPIRDHRTHLIVVITTRLLLMAFVMEAPLNKDVGDRGSIDCHNSVSHRVNRSGHSMLRIDCCRNRVLYEMDPLSPAPMNSWYNSVEDKARKHTTTGKRSRHTCCLEPADSLHISIAGSCKFASLVLGIPPEPNLVNSLSL